VLSVIVWAQTLKWRIRNRLRRQEGQTTSEYLVIAGIVVAVLLVIFGLFGDEISAAMDKLIGRVRKSSADR